MNILDSVILVIFIIGILSGIKNGALKHTVTLIGSILVIVFAFKYKYIVAKFLYEYLPFFKLGGDLKDIPVMNILIYELAAFLLLCIIFGVVYTILLKITGIIEKVFNATIILGFVSKLLGAALGFIQGYVIVFFILFFFKQPFINLTGINDSRLANAILSKTPVLTKVASKTLDVIDEFDTLKDKYNNENDKEKLNVELLRVFLDKKIVTINSVKTLKEKNKLNFSGLDSLINEYGG
jgi:uncharacterized membrane protein required for colicin V production